MSQNNGQAKDVNEPHQNEPRQPTGVSTGGGNYVTIDFDERRERRRGYLEWLESLSFATS